MISKAVKAKRLSITVVVDNIIDIFLRDQDTILYPHVGPNSSLLAEQGLSIWVEVEAHGGESCRILYDFGRGGLVVRRNLKILGIDPSNADYWVLSHGHIDHYGGLSDLIKEDAVRSALVVVHPRAFGPRGIRQRDGSMAGQWALYQEEVESLLQEPIFPVEKALQIGPGVWISGFIPRSSTLDPIFSAAVRKEADNWVADSFEDDLALFIALEDAGIVIITGCCHAGAINTIRAASTLFPRQPIHALVGGLHLNFSSAETLERIIREMAKYNLRWILPLHCTGAAAQDFLREFFSKERCPFSTVGMRMVFE